MKRVRFGKTELMVSEIAFGGIPIQRVETREAAQLVRGVIDLGVNFLDTANGYTDSEEKIGLAIRELPRDSLVIASKSGAADKKTFLQHLDLTLKHLGTDYVDLYQHHGISSMEFHDRIFQEGGAHEGMQEAVRAGKVRYPAFTSHSIPLAMKIMREHDFASVQLPFNFVDDEAAKEAIPLAKELDMGFIAMKPFGGGLLDDANLCIRYLMQFDSIVPDPGIEKLSEMQEIVCIIEQGNPLTEADVQEINRMKVELGDHWCHRCDYCQPCPEKIAISLVLNMQTMIKRMPFKRVTQILGSAMDTARGCAECRACVERCPYNLDIPELIKQRLDQWDRYLANGE